MPELEKFYYDFYNKNNKFEFDNNCKIQKLNNSTYQSFGSDLLKLAMEMKEEFLENRHFCLLKDQLAKYLVSQNVTNAKKN